MFGVADNLKKKLSVLMDLSLKLGKNTEDAMNTYVRENNRLKEEIKTARNIAFIHQKAKQDLRDAIEEVQQTQDMLYDEHYDLQAWRENHIVTDVIFKKALRE